MRVNGYLCRVLIWFGGVIRDRITWEAGVLGREVDNIYRKKICKTNLPLPPPTKRGTLGCYVLTVRNYVNKRFFVCFRALTVWAGK